MIRQLHYTSTRHGRDGIAGFQVAAATPGIPTVLEDGALPLAAYRPRPSATAVPTPAEIAALPVAFGYRPFGSGAVVFRSEYLGEDFTGRQGNYFAHVLVFDRAPAELGGVLPAEVWDAGFWARPGTAAGTELPPADPVRPGPGAGGEAIAVTVTGRADEFASVFDATREVLSGRRRQVVLVGAEPGPDAAVARVVLAVTASLPRTLALRVSFTTFSATPADTDVLIVGTTSDVPIGATVARDRIVLHLGGPDTGAPVGGYAELAVSRWERGAVAAAALRDLAESVRPSLGVDELDDLAEAARLLHDDLGVSDPLRGVEFLLDRHAGGMGPRVWSVLDERVARGELEVADLSRWSAVLRRTGGAGPLLQEAYLRSVLNWIAGGSDGAQLWMPVSSPERADAIAAWAVTAVQADPTAATAGRVLDVLQRLGVEPADADLRAITDVALLPLLLDPSGDLRALDTLPGRARLLRVMAEQLEERLDDDVVGAVVADLSPESANLLSRATTPGSRCDLIAGAVLARAGRRDPVDLVIREAPRHGGPQRVISLAWAGPPPAADAARLVRALPAQTWRDPLLTGLLAERLHRDVREAGCGPEQIELARRMHGLPVDLPPRAQDTVEAVLLTDWFRHPGPGRTDGAARVQSAARLIERIDAGSVGPLAAAAVGWLFGSDDVAIHVGAARMLLGATAPDARAAYRHRLVRIARDGDASGIVAPLIAVAHLAATDTVAAELLEAVCAELRGRRGSVLDAIGKGISEHPGLPAEVNTGGAVSWTAWWAGYRRNQIESEPAGMQRLLRRFRKGG